LKMIADHGFTLNFEGFYTLHPLIVHFPIAFIILAMLLQVLDMALKKDYGLVILIVLALGFVGAVVATTLVHPHTSGLTAKATVIFQQHELFGKSAMWISGIAVSVKSLKLFFWKHLKWLEMVFLVLVIFSSIAVSLAGHFGAELVHIEGVGPRGKYLELHDEHEH